MSGQVAGLQILVQGVNAITGIVLVRYMPKDDYAWFTIASSLLATLNLLADGGVSTGLTAIGGGIYEQSGRFARLLHDGLRISFRLSVIGCVLATPLFYVLYDRIAAPPWLAVSALLLAALAVWPSVSTVLINVANQLHTRVGVIQVGNIIGAVTRLLLTGVLFVCGWLVTLPAMGAAVVSSWVTVLFIRKRAKEFLREPAVEVSYAPELRGFVRSLYANYIFFCLQAQVSTWIIGWLAGSSEVADLGALGRLGVLFVAMTSPINFLALPAIARIREPRLLRQRIALALGGATLLATAVVVVACLFPTPFLWILGGNYGHLTSELPLALTAQGVNMIAALAWSLLLSRGWVRHAWATILSTLIGFAVGAALFSLGTVAGMLKFNTIAAMPTLLFCLAFIVVKLARPSHTPSP